MEYLTLPNSSVPPLGFLGLISRPAQSRMDTLHQTCLNRPAMTKTETSQTGNFPVRQENRFLLLTYFTQALDSLPEFGALGCLWKLTDIPQTWTHTGMAKAEHFRNKTSRLNISPCSSFLTPYRGLQRWPLQTLAWSLHSSTEMGELAPPFHARNSPSWCHSPWGIHIFLWSEWAAWAAPLCPLNT